MTPSMTIQQAAKQTGLSVHTLRYYERIGLLDPVARRDNTHRLFREEDIRWIDFLLKLRGTGLPVRDMLRYAELRRQGDTSESVAARKALLVEHTRSVEKTLAELPGNPTILQKKNLPIRRNASRYRYAFDFIYSRGNAPCNKSTRHQRTNLVATLPTS